jgi:amino acid adenylation domain-containing protein
MEAQNIEDIYELAPVQQGLFFHTLSAQEAGVYCIQLRLSLRGRLNVAAFRQAWQQALRRHPVLRTSFYWEDSNKPLQVVHRQADLSLAEHDWRGLSATDRQAQFATYLESDQRLGFDFKKPPLMRLALLRMADDQYEFVWSHHHLILDGWSMSLLLKEVFTFYEAETQERQSNQEPARPYGDYIAWLRRRDVGGDETFWRECLKGFTTPTQLRVERTHGSSTVEPHVSSRRRSRLSAGLTADLQAFARRNQLTLNTTVQGAWALLLSRYSGERDVVFGAVVSTRPAELRGAELIIGPLINTLPVRVKIKRQSTVVEWLREMQAFQARMQNFSSTSLIRIQGWGDVSRGLPLFETAFAFENYPVDKSLRQSGAALAITDVGHTSRSNYALTLVVLIDPDLELRLTYDANRFAPDTVEQMLGHMESLLVETMADGQRRLANLSMLTAGEREQLIVEWNQTECEFQSGTRVHDLFEEQAKRTPSAIAIAHKEGQLTYEELNRRASQTANYLRRFGVGPDVLVGICVKRSPEMVIGFLGTLKAGGAYVPIDPDYPVDRLNYMLKDAAAPIVLTQKDVTKNLPIDRQIHLIYLDADRERIAEESEECPSPLTTPQNLVYVIYTSGSTGRPKGVQLTHQGLCNTVNAMRPAFELTTESRVAQLASFSFDASFFEIMLALSVGATLYIGARPSSLPGALLLEMLREEEITIAVITPSALAVLPEELLPALKNLVIAGEAGTLDLVRRWGGTRRFFNAYGPTEVSIWSTLAECYLDTPRLTIGRPVSNTKIYLLDDEMQPVPIGVPGEVYISGPCLSRSYLNRPDLTSEKFMPNPFAERPGSRFYRSGDRARYLPNGEIEFIERIDRQVKIRGFRIEIGEIEAVLSMHPAAREVAVIAGADAAGDKRLVAYLVLHHDVELSIGELRKFLLTKLPEYMVPASFVTLDALPLTPNGKLDLSALPNPEGVRPNLKRKLVLPETELEIFLADCWREVFGIGEVGVHDNFFELGGDSIKVIAFTNKLQERLGEIVHVVAVYDAQTIAELVDYLYEHNRQSVSRLFGEKRSEKNETDESQSAPARIVVVNSSMVEHMRRLITPLSAPVATTTGKNPPAIFILSAPRAGSTLFRVMLGGSPALFAPPELEILSFNTLRERKKEFSGRDSFWAEGTIRAIMEIKAYKADEASRIMCECEDCDLSAQDFYRLLQGWIGEKRLVDKTPSYALDLEILKRAEAMFDGALYIHLLRHPHGMIRSFEEARIDQLLTRYEHPFSTREFAELVWIISQQNILRFLAEVPARRQHRVRFENLVNEPQQTLEEVCRFLNIDLHPDMLQPYKNQGSRMTDGIHASSRMLGDVKFHQHKKIDAKVATSWQEQEGVVPLGEITWQLAEAFGYHRSDESASSRRPVSNRLTPIQLIERSDQAELPLSFAQQRLWFLDQLEPGSLSYNCAGLARFKGKLDVEALEKGINQIVQRHEALRTTFPSVNGVPRQVISSMRSIQLPVFDLSSTPRAQREAEVARLVKEEAARPFDLSRGPLLRIAFLRLSEEEHALLVTMHHIISDGWSIGIFMRELATLYQAFTAGQTSLLSELPIQYADFAKWQREWLQGQVLEEQLQYWRGQLAGASAVLELPTDRPRPAVQSYRGARHGMVLCHELTTGLKALAQSEAGTLFMSLLTTFKVLLWRWSGQPDVVVGTPIAGRTRAETETLIGFFVNTLALRTKLEGERSFRESLRQVREVCLGAYANQEVPFEKLVEELQPERSLGHTPLFQVFFNLLNARDNEFELPGLIVESMEGEIPASKFDITLYAREQQDSLRLEMVYNADIFSKMRVAEMMSQFAQLLEQIVRSPDQSIAKLSLVTPQAKMILPQPDQPLYAAWDEAVQTRFARQARANPKRVAVIDGQVNWSYAYLNAHSDNLANYLRGGGICPQEIVVVYAHRSASLVWALLGILKAGAAFLILDPAYPLNRLIECLNIANPHGWIQLEAAGELPEELENFLEMSAYRCRLTLPRSPDDAFLMNNATGSSTEVMVGPDDLAYVAFTSGSTGRPNGILGSHGPLSHFFRWYSQTFGLGDSDRFAMFSGLAHDPLLRDIFTPLWLGGTLCIPEQDDLTAPGKLTDWARRESITIAHLTPAIARLMAGADEKTAVIADAGDPVLPSLRYVFFGGDLLTGRDVFITRQLAKPLKCVNFYGATETPQAIAYYSVDPNEEEARLEAAEPIPIGRGIADVQLLVLNDAQKLAGIGELGEIYVRTPYLAKGYLGDESLTAARFIINPMAKVKGDCLYRTGDRGRYLPDGTVMFVGRIDQQVKIRGFRIELGEVEAALGQYESVQMVAVKLCTDASGDNRLVAYIVSRAGLAPTVNEIRDLLRKRLPDYMIPSVVLLLEQMPLTPNGKINRLALPEPDWTQPSLGVEYVAPRTPVEKKLVGIWMAILGVERIGVHDNFFDLGGHSLLATQVVSRIHKAFHIEVPLRLLFQAPTIAESALAVTQMLVDLESEEDLAQIFMEIKQLSEVSVPQIYTKEI